MDTEDGKTPAQKAKALNFMCVLLLLFTPSQSNAEYISD